MNVLLLDVEGLSDPMRDDSDSSKDDDALFTLSVLLSSLLIINTTGTIDSKKFEALQVATNLSERIRVHGTEEEPNSMQIAQQMPYLLWLVRDFTLELTKDMRDDDDYFETCLKETPLKPGKKIPSADQVKQCIKLYFPRRGCVTAPTPGTPEQMPKLESLPLEALNPRFRQKMPMIIKRITQEITPKRIVAQKGIVVPVDGAGLVAIIRTYVDSINKGALPDVESAWQLLQKSHCQEAINGAKLAFIAALERGRKKVMGSTERPLDITEVEAVSTEAFAIANNYFKKNAVGEQATTQTYMQELQGELVTYKEGKKPGLLNVNGGLLKEFTDKNYTLATESGEKLVQDAITTLQETSYPDFETFKAAREQVANDLGVKLQKNVAFTELSESYLGQLNNLSTKVGLQFEISDVEKQKEKILTEAAQKEIEQEKKNEVLRQALVNRKQQTTNVAHQRDFVQSKSAKDYTELKEQWAWEAKQREKQIEDALKHKFNKRAGDLQKEFKASTNALLVQMMNLQKESQKRQEALTQQLLQMNQQAVPRPAPVQQSGGLLSGLLGGILGGLLGGH